MSLKNILFDLDNTIYDFDLAEKNALTSMLIDIGVQPSEEKNRLYSKINLSFWKRLEKGEITRKQLMVQRFEFFLQEINVDFSAARADEIYRGYLNKGHYFLEGAEKMLQSLCTKYRLFLVTNGTADTQKGRIASGGLEKYFEKIFISDLIGYDKPSKQFFEHCFAHMGEFEKSETIIIGDSLTSDIQGGIHAGITTLWFNGRGDENSTEVVPDYEVHRLCEIEELLQRI